MASNLSTIGFEFKNEQDFREAMLACAAQVRDQLPCEAGEYGIWRSRSGAEVWFHLGRSGSGDMEIFGLTPFFEGKSEVVLGLSQAIRRESDNPFEGALHGFVGAKEGGLGGTYPLVFEAVDFGLSGSQEFPVLRRVRLAAFAREVKAHADEAAYYAAHEGSGAPQFAAQSFIPIGLFAAEQTAEENSSDVPAAAVPPSTAMFTGKVLEHNRLTNEASGRSFDWMLVETLEAAIDVLADPAVVAGEIFEGCTVEVSALLFGRVLA